MQGFRNGMLLFALTSGMALAESPFHKLGTYEGQGGQFASAVAPGPVPGSERLYATYLYEGKTFDVTSVDLETGDFRVIQNPVKGEYGARCMAVGPDGNVYLGTLPTAHLLKLDTKMAKLVDLGRPSQSEQYVWDVTFGEDGKLYGGTYPGARLVRYDPATGKLEDLGRMDPTEQYARYVAGSRDGFIYVGIGTRRMNVAAFSTATGEHREILPERFQGAGTVEVHRGADGLVYATAGGQAFRLQGWTATPIEKSQAAPRLSSNRTRDGKVVTLEAGSISVVDPGTKQITKLPYGYRGRDLLIFRLVAGSDGRVYASSMLPARLLRLEADGGRIEELGELGGGEVYRFLSHRGRLLMAAYACASPLMSFDPGEPFRSGPPANPARINFPGQDMGWRPQALVSGSTGAVYVGAIPGYGKLGGPLCEWIVESGKVDCTSGVVPDQGISALVAWRGLVVGGSTTAGGGGSKATQATARLFVWDPVTRGVVFVTAPVPGASSIENLVVAPSGLVYGIAGRKLFAFDVEKRAVSLKGDLPFPGGTLPGALGVGPGGWIWGLAGHPDAGVFSIDPSTGRIALVARPPEPIEAGFAIVGRHLYFGSGASIYRFDLPDPAVSPDAKH
jgi:hypothetical protein